MRKWIALVILSAACGGAGNENAAEAPVQYDGPYTFAGIPWGSSFKDTERRLVVNGFRYTGEMELGGNVMTQCFEGWLFDRVATVCTDYLGDELLSVRVELFVTSDHGAESTITEVRNSLTEKYGPPTDADSRTSFRWVQDDGKGDNSILSLYKVLTNVWLHYSTGQGSARIIESSKAYERARKQRDKDVL